jgi:hypothetical protein
MIFWSTFWAVLFAVVLGLYAILAVYISIGGFKDIKDMFRNLDKKRQGDDSADVVKRDEDGDHTT